MRLIDIAGYDLKEAEIQWTTYGANTVTIHRKKTIDLPTVDAVPVVRCKDCKWFINDHNEVDGWMTCTLLRQEVDKEWFCRDGERKPK